MCYPPPPPLWQSAYYCLFRCWQSAYWTVNMRGLAISTAHADCASDRIFKDRTTNVRTTNVGTTNIRTTNLVSDKPRKRPQLHKWPTSETTNVESDKHRKLQMLETTNASNFCHSSVKCSDVCRFWRYSFLMFFIPMFVVPTFVGVPIQTVLLLPLFHVLR